MHKYTEYFKESPGFNRFIKKIYDKYKSLGRFSGKVKLKNLSQEEAKSLSRLFGITYKTGDDETFSISKFISIMKNSKYDDFDIGVLIQEYLNVELYTNKEKNNQNIIKEQEFYKDIIQDNSKGSSWLQDIINFKKTPYRLIHQRYNKNKIALKKELINIISLIDNLPTTKVLLPIYASNYTKDPHYLDLDNFHNILYFYALSYIDNCSYPESREEKIKLLSKYNIEIDNLSNYVLTYNLLSSKNYINQFSNNKETLILNIQNIITTEWFDTKAKKVFIFENPSILSEIIMRTIDCSVIISGGFPNTSVYLLLDKLIESGNKLYYNGDFDPEGLLIAGRLKEKYKDKMNLFCYNADDYNKCLSKKEISDKRLSKLIKIDIKELKDIISLLTLNKLAAYQENNKERIIDYINNSYE